MECSKIINQVVQNSGDTNHAYRDILKPIMALGLSTKPLTIGAGSWLGNHAVVIGCSIGKNCVVGANAVVTHDVPDYCVVAGAPARVIKRYDFGSKTWVHVPRKTSSDELLHIDERERAE